LSYIKNIKPVKDKLDIHKVITVWEFENRRHRLRFSALVTFHKLFAFPVLEIEPPANFIFKTNLLNNILLPELN